MTKFVMHYKHTEYRTLTVEAVDVVEAHTKWLRGEGEDEFVSSGGDFEIIGIDLADNQERENTL